MLRSNFFSDGSAPASAGGEQGSDNQDDRMPMSFVCSITNDLMTDPVVTRSGQSYERAAIEQWFQATGRFLDPNTNEELEDGLLISNHALRGAIDELRENMTAQEQAELAARRRTRDLNTLVLQLQARLTITADTAQNANTEALLARHAKYTAKLGQVPNDPYILWKRGEVSRELGEDNGALADFNNAMVHNPSADTAELLRVSLGAVNAKLGNYNLALQNLNLVLAAYPGDMDARCLRASVYIQQGQLDNAEADLAIAAQQNYQTDFLQEQQDLLAHARTAEIVPSAPPGNI